MLPAGNPDEVELNSSTSSRLPAGSIVGALYHKLEKQSSAPEDGRNYSPKHVELIGIINKPLLLHLVGCLYYCISDARSYKHKIQLFNLFRN
jgi:hypothetical protein